MLRRVTLFVLLCIAAGAVAPPSHWGAGDRRDRVAGSQRMVSAVWLHAAADRPLCYTNAARPAHRLRSVTTLPSYRLATHLSL
jgi:hypothetical protein